MTLLIPRKTWGSTYSYGTRHNARPADPHKVESVLHTTVTVAPDLLPPYDDEYAAMRTLERIGVDRFGSGVSYNAVIMPTGRAYAGMPLDTKATHSEFERWNWDRASIALCGDYSKHKPTTAMIAAVVALQVEWRKAGTIGTVVLRGHYEVAAKACPGRWAIVKMDGIAVAARRALATPESLKDKPAVAPAPTLKGLLEMKLTDKITLPADYEVVKATGQRVWTVQQWMARVAEYTFKASQKP